MATAAYGTPGGVGYVDPFAPQAATQQNTAPVASTGTIARTSAPQPTYTPVAGTANTVTQSTPAPQAAAQTTAPVNTSYQMTPQEASGGSAGIAAYNARIASLNNNLPAPGTTSSTGVTNNATTAGQTAPASSVVNPSIQQPAASNIAQPTTYGGLVNSLSQNSLVGSPVAGQAAQGLISSGQNNALTSSPAYQKYLQDTQALQTLQSGVGNAYQKLETGTQALPVVLGQEGAIQKNIGTQEQALQSAIQNDLALSGLNIQEQGQQQSGLTSAGNIGNTAQGLLQSGLTSAAGAAAPSGNYPFTFNPLTGQFSSGTGSAAPAGSVGLTGNYAKDTQSLAQQVASLQVPYDSAVAGLSGFYGQTATGNLNAAIQAAGGNVTQLQAQSSAIQSNIQTAGTAQTNVGAQGLGPATQNYTNAYTYNGTATSQAQILQKVLSDTGINSSNSNDWNKAVNNLQSRMGSTNYTQFITALNELQNSYSQLLSTGGGTPTQNDVTALQTLNGNYSANQINSAITTLQADASAKLSSLYNNVQTYQNITNGGQSTQTNSSGTTSTQAGGNSFVLKNGIWVAE